MFEIFGQVIETHDIVVIFLLILLEGILSLDNALVLGLLARRLPKRQQARALSYGLVGAFFIRLVAIGCAQFLLNWQIVKLLGGGYLAYVAIHYFWSVIRSRSTEKITADAQGQPELVDRESGKPLDFASLDEEAQARTPVTIPDRQEIESTESMSASTNNDLAVDNDAPPGGYARFWPTVIVIELTDLAFAVDSILAAIAMVGPAPLGHTGFHPKLWLVFAGGMLGVILMRFAAAIFIGLLDRFPRFEYSAYLLVLTIGVKLCLDWYFNSPEHPHRLDFHSLSNPAFWAFWLTMLACFLYGFIPAKGAKKA